MRPTNLGLLPLAFAVAAPTKAQQPARTPPPAVARYFALVRPAFSGERARNVVAFMEQYFRIPGNTGFNATIGHVEAILKAAGYVEQSRATNSDRLTYRVDRRPLNRLTWEPVDASLTIVGETEPVLRWATNRNMLAINSRSTPDTGVVSPVVDVGPGTPADYDRAPVAGKIVLADGNVGRVFTEAVLRRGAIGVLTYGLPAYTQPETHRNSIQFGSISDSAKSAWAIILSKNAVDRLRAALAKGPISVRAVAKAKSYPASEELTLVAEVRGSATPEERFVLSAHIQEPGANDNASGVGDLSEMARVIAGLLRAKQVDPKRTITMLFGNEISQTRNYLAADSSRSLGPEPRHGRRRHAEDGRHFSHREDARSVGHLDSRRRQAQRMGRPPAHEDRSSPALLQRFSARALLRSGRRDRVGCAHESVRGRQRSHAVPRL